MKNEIVCPNCGKINPKTAEFCSDCLTRFSIDEQLPEETPEWLKKIRERSQAEKPPTPPLGDFGEAEDRTFGNEAEAAEEIPDWLRNISPNQAPPPEFHEETTADWMARLHELIPPSDDNPAGQSTTLYSEEELAAMAAAARKINALTQDPPDEGPTRPLGVPKEEPSDFMYEPTAGADEPPSAIANPHESAFVDEPPTGGFPAEQLPAGVEPASEIPAARLDGMVEDSVPWMREPAASPSPDLIENESEQNLPDIAPVPEPELTVKEPAAKTPKPAPVPEEPESQANPFASLFGDDEPDNGDKPENLIPAGIIQPRYDRPAELSARLEISDTQKSSIDLLKRMLTGEMRPSGPVKNTSRFSGRIWRLIIGILLIGVMLYPLITGDQLTGQQVLFSPGVVAMHASIKALPENGRILVITDYEPAFAGEMKAASAGVIDSLMMKGMNFSLLSTVPTGPVLSRDLINTVRPASSGYQPEKIAYLGYLPGGTTGMLDFIRNPRAAMPLLDTGRYAWTYPATQAVNTIQDYAAILVITENSEIGRAWLEQLYTAIPDKPILMVVSAQSAPLMRPYLDSTQLKGLVGGRVEGAMYDRIMEAPSRQPAVNASYQAGMLLAAVLILLGGVIGLFNSIIHRRPPASMEDRHVG